MEFHQARYFLALAHTLNFTRAAEQCNVTQPALTKAIQKLEHELGGDLVCRERQLTQLTDLGRLVLPKLRQIVGAADEARDQAREFRDKNIASLQLGLSPTVSASIIVEPLTELARAIPALKIEMIEQMDDQMPGALMAGGIHGGIAGAGEPLNARIDRLHLFTERYVILMSCSHPFADLAAVPIFKLRDADWLERVGCCANEQLRRVCFSSGSGPGIVHRGQQESHLQYLAAAGFGILLAPEHSPRLPQLCARPIDGDPVKRSVELLIMSGRRRPPALEAFVKLIRLRDWRRALDRDLSEQRTCQSTSDRFELRKRIDHETSRARDQAAYAS